METPQDHRVAPRLIGRMAACPFALAPVPRDDPLAPIELLQASAPDGLRALRRLAGLARVPAIGEHVRAFPGAAHAEPLEPAARVALGDRLPGRLLVEPH